MRKSGIVSATVCILLLFLLVAISPAAAERDLDKQTLAAQWIITGDLAAKVGHFPEAIEAYTTALKYNPKTAKTWLTRGYTYQRSGNMADADSDYATAISLDPSLKGKVETYRGLAAHTGDSGYLSGTVLRGSSIYGSKGLIVDNSQGSHDAIVALAPASTKEATVAVYVKRGYQHTFTSSVPEGMYDLYIQYGTRFNQSSLSFDDAMCERYLLQIDFSGYKTYTVTLISWILSPIWLIPSIQPIPKSEFPRY